MFRILNLLNRLIYLLKLMTGSLFFHLQYVYNNTSLEKFKLGYFKKKETDPNVLKKYSKDPNKTEYLMTKKIPFCFHAFTDFSNTKYLESIFVLENQIEINIWKTLGKISSQVNMIVHEDITKNQTILKAVFNCINIPIFFNSTIKKYITQEFYNEREKETKIIASNNK